MVCQRLGSRPTGNADQAVVQYKKAVVSKPGFFKAYYNMGIAYAQMNKSDDAAAHPQARVRARAGRRFAHSGEGAAR
jgi:hypothetical protein